MTKPHRVTLNDNTHREVVNLLHAGCTIADAARNLAIEDRTIRRWRQRGAAYEATQQDGAPPDPREAPYGQFWHDTERAGVTRKVAALVVVHDAMRNEDAKIRLQAATWYLERRFPDEFGRQNRQVEHSGTVKLDTPEAIGHARREAETLVDELASRRARSGGNGQTAAGQ